MEDIIIALQFAAQQDTPHFVSEEGDSVVVVRAEGSGFTAVTTVENSRIVPIS